MASTFIRIRLLLLAGLFCASAFLVGCVVSVRAPTDQQVITTLPVVVTVGANATMTLQRVQRTSNGVTTNVTGDFQYVDQYSAQASWANLADGTYTVDVTADVYCWYCTGPNVSGDSRVFVVSAMTPPLAPTLSSVTPNSGPVGTLVALQGTGFANGMSVIIGGQTIAATAVSGSTAATAVVPFGLTGTVNVNVKVSSQSSGSKPFTITAPPMQTYRTGASDIQRVDASVPTAPVLVDTFASGLSAGGMANTVGCARTTTRLLRSTTTNLESCPVDAAGNVGPTCFSLATGLSSTVSDVAVSGSVVVRANDSGIQVFSLAANGSLTLTGSTAGTMSAGGSAVDLPKVASPTFVVRAHASGIDIFDISLPSAPTLAGRVTNAGVSSTGVDVKVIGTTKVLRAFSSGLDQYDISSITAPTRTSPGPLNVGLSSSRTGLALFANDTRAVRSTSQGIEVFDITASPSLLGRAPGDLSSAAGTDVVIDGNGNAVRSSDENVEVYDVATDQALPTLKGSVRVTTSSTGVCIVNR